MGKVILFPERPPVDTAPEKAQRLSDEQVDAIAALVAGVLSSEIRRVVFDIKVV